MHGQQNIILLYFILNIIISSLEYIIKIIWDKRNNYLDCSTLPLNPSLRIRFVRTNSR